MQLKAGFGRFGLGFRVQGLGCKAYCSMICIISSDALLGALGALSARTARTFI